MIFQRMSLPYQLILQEGKVVVEDAVSKLAYYKHNFYCCLIIAAIILYNF